MGKNTENRSETRREDWGTPQWLFDQLDYLFQFDMDLAANRANAKCDRYLSDTADGHIDFFDIDPEGMSGYSCWCNPPYSREANPKWAKALMKYENVVVLHQASVGAKWFRPFWEHADCLVFLPHRLQFEGAKSKAQFDSVIVIKQDRRISRWLHSELQEIGYCVMGSGISPFTGGWR
jgi:site-specific DNA-methyltransferase (adenine-specific)